MDDWEQLHTNTTLSSIATVFSELCRAMKKPSEKAYLTISSYFVVMSG